jgi:hypothetical protein
MLNFECLMLNEKEEERAFEEEVVIFKGEDERIRS